MVWRSRQASTKRAVQAGTGTITQLPTSVRYRMPVRSSFLPLATALGLRSTVWAATATTGRPRATIAATRTMWSSAIRTSARATAATDATVGVYAWFKIINHSIETKDEKYLVIWSSQNSNTMTPEFEDYKFHNVYEFAEIISGMVDYETGFWNYD